MHTFRIFMKITNLASLAHVLWKLLELYNHNPQPIFREAGLDLEKLKRPGARYDIENLEKAWAMAASVINDPCFGLEARKVWHPSHFGALGYAMLSSETILEALLRLERYHKIIIGWKFIKTVQTDSTLNIILDSGPSGSRETYHRIDAFMAILLEICSLNLQRRLIPIRVEFRHKSPKGHQEKYHELFGTIVRFSAPKDTLIIPLNVATESLTGANADLSRVNEQAMTSYLANINQDNLIEQVRSTIATHLPTGNVSEELVANRFCFSSRTLQRRLSKRGTTFQKLLDQVRFELAQKYLKESEISMTEVAFLLGFSDTSSFSRAFKRWTGKSPRQYLNSLSFQ